MPDEEFEKLVGEALDSLPEEFAKRMENVSVTIADFPNPHQLRKMNLPLWALLFGLYEGVPLTRRGSNYSGVIYSNSNYSSHNYIYNYTINSGTGILTTTLSGASSFLLSKSRIKIPWQEVVRS